MTACDKLGRRSRHRAQSTGKRVTPQERDLVWFEKLHEHGPLPSSFLLQFSQASHRSEKCARERLTDLFNEDNTPHDGPYLSRPPQQFRTLDSRYQQLVYAPTPASETALKQAALWNDQTAARSGPWLHSFMVGCITASIELATLDRRDITFLPQSYLLARAKTDLRYPIRHCDPGSGTQRVKDLIPDALFGLEYKTRDGPRYRCFLVEADRSTEPATSSNLNRKSWQGNFLQYEQYVGRNLYRKHLALKAPLMVLTVVTDRKRLPQVLRLAPRHAPSICSQMLFQTWEDFVPVFSPPAPNFGLLNGPWNRANQPPFRIDMV